MTTTVQWLLALLLAWCAIDCVCTSASEVESLLNFYHATGGGLMRWMETHGWGQAEDIHYCDWYGVTCTDGSPKHVIAIELPNNHLMGSIPVSFWEGLSATLEVVDLNNNPGLMDISFSSSNQQILSGMKLRVLNLSGTGVRNITGLDYVANTLEVLQLSPSIDLDDYLLGRPFPGETIQQLTNLRILELPRNHFTGSIMNRAFENLVKLEILNLAQNGLEGPLPDLSPLVQLHTVNFRENAFNGTIHESSIDSLQNLSILQFQDNMLEGSLPDLNMAVALRYAFFQRNRLSGTIPTVFLQQTEPTHRVITINLESNQLMGAIPASLGRFEALNLHLSHNVPGFDGPLPSELCARQSWMNGDVAQYGCNAILCQSGSFQPHFGRQTSHNLPCVSCHNDRQRLGRTDCGKTVYGAKQDDLFDQQTRVLAQMYISLQGYKQWHYLQGWNQFDSMLYSYLSPVYEEIPIDMNFSDIDVCSFHGIHCNNEGHVEQIAMTRNQMSGTIPDEIFVLPALASMDLSHNSVEINDFAALKYTETLTRLKLSHTSVQSIQGIDKIAPVLKELWLDGCDLSKEDFPTALYGMKDIQILHLEETSLVGTLSTQVGQLSNLRWLSLNNNALTGSIPSELLNLKSLQHLDLSDNVFSGILPNVDGASQLLTLKIDRSRGGLGGPLPSLAGLVTIQELSLTSNKFNASIPINFLEKRQNEESVHIRLSMNNLEGGIPTELARLSTMILEIENNKISGIPEALCQQPGRCDAILCPSGTWSPIGRANSQLGIECEPCEGNRYFGESSCSPGGVQFNTEVEILDKVFFEASGWYWNVSHTNWTKEQIPLCYREGVICGVSTTEMNSGVTELRLNGFGLRGRIPTEIYQLPYLRNLDLSYNPVDLSFQGLEKASNLESISLMHTYVESLPKPQQASEKLHLLDVSSARLKGSFPSELFEIRTLRYINLDDNHLTGPISPDISRLSELQHLSLGNNAFSATIPNEIALLKELKHLSLNDNRLSGQLPEGIQDLAYLAYFDVANQKSVRKLFGPILTFSTAPALNYLNMSMNSFTGTIPASLASAADKDQLIKIDLASNDLEGGIPVEFNAFKQLYIKLGSNRIDSLPPILCENHEWMGGITGVVKDEHRCDSILCGPHSFSPTGMQMHRDNPCQHCPGSFGAPFFGSVECTYTFQMQERNVLIRLAEGAGVKNWINDSNWLSQKNVCSWFGVTCSGYGAVVKLSLRDNGIKVGSTEDTLLQILAGMMPQLKDIEMDCNDNLVFDFHKLTVFDSLERLSVSRTGLSSLEGVSSAKNLRVLIAAGNSLAGNLPGEIFTLTSMEKLVLSDNRITGELPTALSSLTSLEVLNLSNNALRGSIPTNIGNMVRLKELVLARNQLSGSLPTQLNDIVSLEKFDVNHQVGKNLINGFFPDFSKATKLQYIDVSNNALSHEISDKLFASSNALDSEIVLNLDNNDIEGKIPSSLKRFSNLDIRLANNRIDGIPTELCSANGWSNGMVGQIGSCDAILCPKGYFLITGRQESIDQPCRRCESPLAKPYFGQTRCNLFSERNVLLDLFYELNGETWNRNDQWASDEAICSWYGIECANNSEDDEGVIAIQLLSNNLHGTLPTETLLLPSLETLDLSGNAKLNISFENIKEPASFLTNLRLTHARLSGLKGISLVPNLKQLAVSGLTGTFPSDVFELAATLQNLDISYCFFVGTLPSRIETLTVLKTLSASFNDFHGGLPSQISQLSMLEELNFSENLLSGTLSGELTSLARLKHLSISRKTKSGRKLSGNLPPFEGLTMLETLYLDGNDFSGYIPTNFLASASSISSFDISSNRLSGNVPPFLKLIPGASLAASQIATETSLSLQRETLLDLFSTCDGNSWPRNDFWNSKVDICSWHGIGCSDDGDVVLINLESNKLRGSVPQAIFQLPRLEVLWLGGNTDLRISLDKIEFSAVLRDLRLDNTALTSLTGIEMAKSLTALDISRSSLDSLFPVELFELPNLRKLNISMCALNGEFPSSLDALPYIRIIDAENNKFDGSLPSFQNSTALLLLRLGHNNFDGPIPYDFLQNVPHVAPLEVYLEGNQLSGSLPIELKRFEALTIDVHENHIEQIPHGLCGKGGWNNGAVSRFGCDGILCPIGYTNQIGRKSHQYPKCVHCPNAKQFNGQTDCIETMGNISMRFQTILAILATIFLGLVSVYIFFRRRRYRIDIKPIHDY